MKKVSPTDMAFAVVLGITISLLAVSARSRPWLVTEYLAHAADVGANLTEGRGYVSDSISDYIVDAKPGSPEGVIPLGMPTVHALFFLALGKSEFVARLPAIVFFAAVLVAVYLIGKKRFGAAAGLVAAALAATDFIFLNIALNGLYFTALSFFLLLAVEFTARGMENGGAKNFIAAGIFSGMAFHFKFGAIVFGFALLILVVVHTIVKGESRKQKPAALFLVAMAIAIAPWFIRNLVAFKSPLYPKQFSRAAYIMKNPNKSSIYTPILDFQPTFEDADGFPTFSRMIHNQGKLLFFVKRPLHEAKVFAKQVFNYQVLSVGILIFAIIGYFLMASESRDPYRFVIAAMGVGALALVLFGFDRLSEIQSLLPLAALSGAYFAIEFYNWLNANESSRVARVYAVFLVLLFAQSTFVGWRTIIKTTKENLLRDDALKLSAWIQGNTSKDDVFITRAPAHLAYYCGAKSVPTPMANFRNMFEKTHRLGARYLVVEFGREIGPSFEQKKERGKTELDWSGLMNGEPEFGAEKVYDDGAIFTVYRLPANPPSTNGVSP